nr:hypothetical protein Iba_chr12aCG15720 [Ipomoea batatas]
MGNGTKLKDKVSDGSQTTAVLVEQRLGRSYPGKADPHAPCSSQHGRTLAAENGGAPPIDHAIFSGRTTIAKRYVNREIPIASEIRLRIDDYEYISSRLSRRILIVLRVLLYIRNGSNGSEKVTGLKSPWGRRPAECSRSHRNDMRMQDTNDQQRV